MYSSPKNQLALGWALNISALALNMILLLGLAHLGAFVLGVALAVAALAAAYLVEGWRAYGCTVPRLYRLCHFAVLFGTTASHAAWIYGASVAIR